jgi:hypothetical protein
MVMRRGTQVSGGADVWLIMDLANSAQSETKNHIPSPPLSALESIIPQSGVCQK